MYTDSGICLRTGPKVIDLGKNNGTCPAPTGGFANTGNPINIGTGNKYLAEVDIPQTTGGLEFRRFYNSQGQRSASPLGSGWQHSFGSRLDVSPISSGMFSGSAVALRSDGRSITFSKVTGASAWESDPDVTEQMVEFSDGSGVTIGYQLVDGRSDRIEHYSLSGTLTEIEDVRTSQRLVLSYNQSNRLASVEDLAGRKLQFAYSGAGKITDIWGPESPIADSSSPHWHYQYDAVFNRLGAVVDPTGATRSYHYEDIAKPYALTGITDENGNRYASYAYDSQGRAYSENQWAGPNKTAPVSQYTLSFQPNYLTQVVDPLGQTRNYQFKIVQGVALADSVSEPCTICGGPGSTKSRTYDAITGFTDLVTDFNNTVTDHDYNTRGLETQRIEAKSINGVTPTEKRTIQTDWHPAFRVPRERRTYNASSVPGVNPPEVVTRWAYNTRGQITARCEIDPDPTVPESMAYLCSAATAPSAAAKVRRTVTTYCEQADVVAGTCPLIGLVTSINGPRATNDLGMVGLDDVTSYTYRQNDDPTCETIGACLYRKGDLWKVTNALGQVTETVKYDKSGRPLRVKDANGTLTDFTYHARGWLVDRIVRQSAGGILSSNDATTHIDYDAVGNVRKVTQADGAYLSYTYDDAHRLIKITDNLNNSIDYCPGGVGSANCLDAAGNRLVEETKDPSGFVKRSLRRQFNALSQLTSVLNANSNPTLSYPTSDGYDPNGNGTHSLDGLNVETKQEYDPLNRLKTTIQDYLGTDPDTSDTTTDYVYDARDNLRTVTDPELYPTNYDYDGLNNLTGLHSPDTGDTSYTYDLAGNRITQTDNRGITSTYTYDALNRVTAIRYPTSSLNVGFAYDLADNATGCSGTAANGRLSRITDASGSTRYCYDRRGNVTSKVQATGADTLTVGYTWSLSDRLTTITYPSGGIATYTRNAVGQLTQLTWKTSVGATPVTVISNATYYPFGPLNEITFGNSRTLTKTYDADYAIDSIASSAPGGLVLDLTTDVMGNITEAGDTLGAPNPTRTYEYDRLYRLKQVNNTSGQLQEGFAYTKTGDRTQKTLPGQSAQVYNYLAGTHRLGSVAGVSRSYDANGNTTNLPGIPYPLVYNDRNRLAQAKLNGAGSPTVYKYLHNGRGERVSKVELAYSGTTTTHAVYDEAGRLLRERSLKSCGGSTFGVSEAKRGAKLTLACGGSRLVELLYLDDLPVAQITNGTLSYLETDHLGTPRIAANPTTNAWQWQWSFFGGAFGDSAPTQAASGGIDVNLRYPGQQFDSETGLNYNYFRDYEAGVGRYLESDPIGLAGGKATYSYTLSSPLNYYDSNGRLPRPGPSMYVKIICEIVGFVNDMAGYNWRMRESEYRWWHERRYERVNKLCSEWANNCLYQFDPGSGRVRCAAAAHKRCENEYDSANCEAKEKERGYGLDKPPGLGIDATCEFYG